MRKALTIGSAHIQQHAWWPCFATAITYHTHREKNEVQLQMLYQRFKTMWSASNCLPLSHLHCQGQRPSLSYPSAGRALTQSALWLLVHMGDSISEVQEEQMAKPPQARQPQLHQTPVPLQHQFFSSQKFQGGPCSSPHDVRLRSINWHGTWMGYVVIIFGEKTLNKQSFRQWQVYGDYWKNRKSKRKRIPSFN